MKNKKQPEGWRNRIVGYGEEAADQILANPKNWRVHPRHQQQALTGVLDEVGWVQNVIVNKRSGCLLDGHLRVAVSLSKGDQTPVPITYVDLSDEEESLMLASLDPLSAMATIDSEKLAELLHEVQTGTPDLQKMLDELAVEAGIVPKSGKGKKDQSESSGQQMGDLEFRVIVKCDSEDHQSEVLSSLKQQGLSCKPLIS